LFIVSVHQLCTNTRTKLYEKLLLEHKQLRDRHKALQAELKVKGTSSSSDI
jgi:cell division septum initiation protein DivIVA